MKVRNQARFAMFACPFRLHAPPAFIHRLREHCAQGEGERAGVCAIPHVSTRPPPFFER